MAVDDTRELFAEVHQVACEPAAIEKIIFRIRAGMEVTKEHDVLDIDAKAAFQYMPREVILFMVMKYIPWMFPIIKTIYGQATNAFTCVDRDVFILEAECGTTQGCVAAGLLYNLGAVKCLQEIVRRLRDSQLLAEKPTLAEGKLHEAEAFSYYDNTTIHAAEEDCAKVLHFINDHGSKFGLHLNLNKCHVLLGVRQPLKTACTAKEMYSDVFNIPRDNIQINPENDPTVQERYVIKLLGGFVGTDSFITRQVRLKLQELQSQQQHILTFKLRITAVVRCTSTLVRTEVQQFTVTYPLSVAFMLFERIFERKHFYLLYRDSLIAYRPSAFHSKLTLIRSQMP